MAPWWMPASHSTSRVRSPRPRAAPSQHPGRMTWKRSTARIVLSIKRGVFELRALARLRCCPWRCWRNRFLGQHGTALPGAEGTRGALGRHDPPIRWALAGIAPDRWSSPGAFQPMPGARTDRRTWAKPARACILSPLVAADLLQEPDGARLRPSHPGCSIWASRAGAGRAACGVRSDLGTVLHFTLGWQVVNPGALGRSRDAGRAVQGGIARFAGVMGAGLANLLVAPHRARRWS